MKFHTVILSAMMLAGCKDSGSNTGDVAVDFLIDVGNELIGDKWANEEQKKKYTPLANLSSEECHTQMGQAAVKILNDPKLQETLPADKKNLIAVAKAQPKETHEKDIKLGAIMICSKLAALKNTPA